MGASEIIRDLEGTEPLPYLQIDVWAPNRLLYPLVSHTVEPFDSGQFEPAIDGRRLMALRRVQNNTRF